MSVSFVSNKEIMKLNKIYRNKNESTDVLSFPLMSNRKDEFNDDTGIVMLGDIVISLETAVKQANIFAHSLEKKLVS